MKNTSEVWAYIGEPKLKCANCQCWYLPKNSPLLDFCSEDCSHIFYLGAELTDDDAPTIGI